MNGLEALENWTRKHYIWEIHNGPNVMPGDGTFVVLKGGGREVIASDYEYEEPGKPISLNDLILKAIELWHADKSLKNYSVCWTHLDEWKFTPTADMVVEYSKVWDNTWVHLKVQGTSEEEVKEKINACYGHSIVIDRGIREC